MPELLRLDEPIRGPLTCDLCGRFVAARDVYLSHEYGDYGTIYSTEVACPRCAGADPEPVAETPEGTE